VGGKWYGGTYGWGFTVVDPVTKKSSNRNTHSLGFVGFSNAYLLTGDDRYLEAWRRQADAINAQVKVVDGRPTYPKMHGDRGWYEYTPEKYNIHGREIYYLGMKPADRERASVNPWLNYLDGKASSFPETALRADLTRVRERVAGMRADRTTPDTRLADDPMRYNPASVTALVQLMLGGIPPGFRGQLLHSRLRYFDPVARRAGVPEDVAALVEKITPDEVTMTLVNTGQLDARTVVVQAGAYAEHRFVSVSAGGRTGTVEAPQLTVRLAPGAGSRMVLRMKRHVYQPTLTFPWDRELIPALSPPSNP